MILLSLLFKIFFWLFFGVFICLSLILIRHLPDERSVVQIAGMVASNVIIILFMFFLHYFAIIAYPCKTKFVDNYVVSNIFLPIKYFIKQQKIIYFNEETININTININNLRG